MLRRNPIFAEIVIAAAALLLFIPFIGGMHLFDWDEINFAESAREMILTGEYLTVQIDFQPFWEKPPLFIWMQVVTMQIFGISEFAARLPNVICGMITLVVIFRTGRRLYDMEFAWLWVLAYIGTFMPFMYFKSGIMDPWFNLFIFTALLNFIHCIDSEQRNRRWKFLIFAAVLLGLANLTKGPVSVLIFAVTVVFYWILNKFRLKLFPYELMVFIPVFLVVGGAWFLIQAMSGNFDIIVEFMEYQIRLLQTRDAGHGGFPLYHVVVLLLGVFPASVFALKGFRRSYYDASHQKKFKLWMIILFLTVLVIFSIVRTKIAHYSSLCWFPLTYLGAYVVYKIINERIRNHRWINVIYAVMGIILGISVSALPALATRVERLIAMGFFQDPLTQASIRTDAGWSGWESLIGVLFICGIIISLQQMRKSRKSAYVIMFLNMTVFINLTLFFTAGKIEMYSQNAYIEFCKEKRGQECYILPVGMKSYAHLFYFDKPVPEHPEVSDQNWLCQGPVDKTAYLILRSKNLEEFMGYYPELELMYEKSGYGFCRRFPPGQQEQDKP
jgi:predicted membrane-bound mannosyltransferase